MVTFTRIFLFLMSLKTSISVECNYAAGRPYFQKSVYYFTLELVKRINIETESHFVTSALTPWTLLLVMSLGDSNTTQQIRKVLKLHRSSCFVYLYLELANEVTSKSDHLVSSTLERASTIFFNASENTNQSFFDILSRGGIYSSRIMYFVDQNETAWSINEHVNSFTEEFIKEIVTPDDLNGLLTLTIDAITFKGAWEVPFPYEDTDTDAFYDDEGKQIGDVSLMYLCASYNVLTIPLIKATVIELPYYGDDQRYSMLIFLPIKNGSVTTTLDLMKNINIRDIFELYKLHTPKKITVQIPRFIISSKIDNLKELLISMGITTIFEEKEVNFPGVSYYQLFLTNFIQRTELEVIEEGIEDGRATATLMQSRFLYGQFVANKPFIFMIADRIQHVPIITGVYSKPSILQST